MKIKNNEKYYETTSFPLANFLYAKNFQLVDIDKTEPRFHFVFINSPELEISVESFLIGKEDNQEVLIDARKMTLANKVLKDRMYADLPKSSKIINYDD